MPVRPSPILATYARIAAIVAVACSPLLALSWFATAGGAETSQLPHVAGWAEPARDLARPLLTFAGPDTVYAVYTTVLMIAFPAVILTALAARSARVATASRPERWGWRIALTGYAIFGIGGAIVAMLLVTGVADALVDVLFMSTMIPGLLISLIGSTLLGVFLLRGGHRPQLTAWLLALAFPLWVAGSFGLGHNSIGLAPLFIAWAATAHRWDADEATRRVEPQPATP